MSLRPLKSLTDFEFRSDFDAPQPEPATDNPNGLDTVAVTASELAELLANARAEGVRAALSQQSADTEARLNELSDDLKGALGDLLELAKCLERVALSPEDARDVRTLMTQACTHIIAGQRDLFVDQ